MSVTDKWRKRALPGNDEDVRGRLREAALALFGAQGYEATTAAAIAARAGVTERTFFRHFADKREVLFDGQAVLRAALTAAIDDAPGGLGPLDTLLRAFRSVLPAIEGNRAFATPRYQVISRTPALRERELLKMAALADAVATALQARDVPRMQALLAAQAGTAAFAQATVAWLEDPALGLSARLDAAFGALRSLLAPSIPDPDSVARASKR